MKNSEREDPPEKKTPGEEVHERPEREDKDEIIFLTEEVPSSSKKADEIIDLVEVVEEPGTAGEQSMDIYDADLPPLVDDEELINLTDMSLDDGGESDDPILLTVVVGEATTAEDTALHAADDQAEGIHQLEDSLDKLFNERDHEASAHDQDDAVSAGPTSIPHTEGDTPPEEGDALEEGISERGEETWEAPSPEQIEAALERVIDKVYARKIERLMVKQVEKKVREEIEKIKGLLLE